MEMTMDAARLARHLQEADNDPVKVAKAITDEIMEPATGLVSRDFLRAEITSLELRLIRHQWLVGGAVVLVLGLLISVTN
jgi:hypothetical protein